MLRHDLQLLYLHIRDNIIFGNILLAKEFCNISIWYLLFYQLYTFI